MESFFSDKLKNMQSKVNKLMQNPPTFTGLFQGSNNNSANNSTSKDSTSRNSESNASNGSKG